MPQKSSGSQSQQQEVVSPMHELMKSFGIKPLESKKSSHGMTVGEVEQLRLKQAAGEELPEIMSSPQSGAHQMKIKEHEKHLIHVMHETEIWEKGKKLSKPFMQKYYVNEFLQMAKSTNKAGEKGRPQNAFGTFDSTVIVHDPRLMGKKQDDVKKSEMKPLTEQSIDELRVSYKTLSGVDANEEDSVAQLIVLCSELQAKGN